MWLTCALRARLFSLRSAGELSRQQVDKIVHVMSEPEQHGVPRWFLNRPKDRIDGKYTHIISNDIGARLRQDLERLKKIRNHRGLRHFWGIRVRGQHTATTGRKGRTIANKKK